MPINADEAFYKQLAEPAVVLLKDPLTDLTRKRQMALLLASVTSLLLSLALITMNEASVLGLKLVFSNHHLVGSPLGAITIYFLILYVLGLWQDYQLHRYLMRPALANVRNTWAQLIEATTRKQEKLRRSAERIQQALERQQLLWETQRTIHQKYTQQIDQLRAQATSLSQQISQVSMIEPNMPMSEQEKHIETMNRLIAQHTTVCEEINRLAAKEREEQDHYDKLSQAIDNEPSEVSSEELSAMWEEALHLSDAQRLNALAYLVGKYQVLNRWRILIEIVFPITLSVVAIALTLVRPLRELVRAALVA